MDTRLFLIPAGIFVITVIIMIIMKLKRDNLSQDYAQQEMIRFVREQIPQLSTATFQVIGCLWNSAHQFVIAYNHDGLFFIPAVPNPMTMKITRYEDNSGAGLKKQVTYSILAGNATEDIDFVPISAITDVKINESARKVKISVKDKSNTYKFQSKDFFGKNQMSELQCFFNFLKQI